MTAWPINRMDLDVRKATPMLYEGRTQIAGRQRRMNSDAQSAALATTAGLQPREGNIHLVNNAPCRLKEFLTGSSRPSTAVSPFEQNRPKTIFQVAEPAAECGLPDIQSLRRLPEAPMLGRYDRPSQVLELNSHLSPRLPSASLTPVLDRDRPCANRAVPPLHCFCPRGARLPRSS